MLHTSNYKNMNYYNVVTTVVVIKHYRRETDRTTKRQVADRDRKTERIEETTIKKRVRDRETD